MILHKTVPAWLEKIPILDISVNHFRVVTTDVPQIGLRTSETVPPPEPYVAGVDTHGQAFYSPMYSFHL